MPRKKKESDWEVAKPKRKQKNRDKGSPRINPCMPRSLWGCETRTREEIEKAIRLLKHMMTPSTPPKLESYHGSSESSGSEVRDRTNNCEVSMGFVTKESGLGESLDCYHNEINKDKATQDLT